MSRFILASASPRRKQLMEQAELFPEIVVSHCDESYPAELEIELVPTYIARKKAEAVLDMIQEKDVVLVAADTIVVINNEVLGKPVDEADALVILKKLNGNSHRVITGVSIFNKGIWTELHDISKVTFNLLTEEQLKHYIKKYKPYDKAGAYAIQEWIGVVGIQQIEGCFYNIMGLPVSKILPHIQ
jgi:septum formation protein